LNPQRIFTLQSVLCVWLLAAAAACSRGSASNATGGGEGAGGRGGTGAPIVVTTATVVQRPMAVDVRAVGNVEASSSVEVRAQVSGELKSVHFREGQDVSAGQVLFRIDPRQFEVAVRQAEATLARSTAEAKGMSAQVERSEQLFKQGLLARSDREALATQMSVLQAAIAADTAQLEEARLQLHYTTIAAPVSGRTGALLVHQGALVRANDPAPLVVINQIAPAFVSFAVPARLLPQVRGERGGLKVLAVPAGATTESPASGIVSFVDNVVDPATDTIRLKATFPNRDRRFWAGAFVDVTLQLSVEPRAIVIPSASVQPSQQGQFVYVVKADQTVEARQVKVAWVAGADAVIESGVQPGETVVTDGQLRLTPGARVSVKAADGQPRTTS
jgi:multidrug efflux system membrane fusion protein